jgi:hypothetical protein
MFIFFNEEIEIVKKILMVLAISLTCVQLQGCLVASIGAAMGAAKWGNAKKMEAQAKQDQMYNEYTLGMQHVNTEREIHHLRPDIIMTKEQYSAQQVAK